MKNIFWTSCILLTMLLAGCRTQAPAPQSVTVNAAVATSSAASSSTIVSASVVVAPQLDSQLSFLIQARVQELHVKEGDPVQAGQSLITLSTPELSLAVSAAEALVKSARAAANLRRYPRKMINQAGNIIFLSGPPELRQIADAQLQQAQSQLDTSRIVLARGTLVSPYSGILVSLNAAPGQIVQPGQIVAVIGDLDHLQIETTDLSERDIARIRIGQTATVQLKAFRQALSGQVIAIAPHASKSAEETVFKVTIKLDTPPADLLWGMSGTVDIQTP